MFSLFSKKRQPQVDMSRLPAHIAFIMDGNGRWARRRGLPRMAGHSAGAKTFRAIAHHCKALGRPYMTVYAFSTENWSRPEGEVQGIMDLLRTYLKEAFTDGEEGIRILFFGDRSRLDQDIQREMAHVEQESAKKPWVTTLCIAMNYGGRDDILHAARQLAARAAAGQIDPQAITPEDVSGCLYTAGIPDPDLIVRTSGEYRLSNFLLWQGAYSELVFTDVLWPDFDKQNLLQAIATYQQRNRRFGGV